MKKTTPASLTKALVPASVEILPATDAEITLKKGYISPLEFCMALVNNDVALLKKLGVDMSAKKRPSLSMRLEAARVSIPYTNRKLPTELHVKGKLGWADSVLAAEHRAKNMRQPYERPEPDDGDRGTVPLH